MRAAFEQMNQQGLGTDQAGMALSSARRECLLMFMDSFGVDSPLVPVSKLARILGKSKAWIYQSIREGSFFLPTRAVGESHMVPVDDLIAWYLGVQDQGEAARGRSSHEIQTSARHAEQEEVQSVDISALPEFDIDRLTTAAKKRVEAARKRCPA